MYCVTERINFFIVDDTRSTLSMILDIVVLRTDKEITDLFTCFDLSDRKEGDVVNRKIIYTT